MKTNRPFLVVSLPERWKEYVLLAKRLSKVNSPLFLAAFENIDQITKMASGIHLHPNGTCKEATFKVPEMIWFKQTSIGVEQTISAIKSLESIGCKNVNSSNVVALAVDKVRCANLLSVICEQGNPQKFDGSIEELMKPGIRWTKPVSASLGKDVMRIVGHGKTALVSRRIAGIPCHKILDKVGLNSLINNTYENQNFMTQEDLGSMRVGGNNFEIRMIMRRSETGWTPSCRIARAGLLISNPNPESPNGAIACSASQAIKMTCNGDYKAILASFENKANEACMLIQASLDDPSEVGELGIDMTMSSNGPTIIEVNSIPDLTFVDKASDCKNTILAMMRIAGMEEDFDDMPKGEPEGSRADIADVIDAKLSDSKYRLMVERELANEEIWLHSGKVSILEDDALKTYSFDDAMASLRREVEISHAWAKKCEHDDKKLSMALECLDSSIHRLLLLKEIYYLKVGKRHVFASLSKAADAGSHMSNIVVPTEKIIEQIDDMEDWLTKLKTQTPRNPNETNTPRGKYIGFEWKIDNWDTPQEWDEFMEDSNYKINKNRTR